MSARIRGGAALEPDVPLGEALAPAGGVGDELLDEVRLVVEIEAGEAEAHRVAPAAGEVHGDLERRRRRLAARARAAHAVAPSSTSRDGVEARDHVGVEVARAVDLVEQLRRDGADVDAPAGAGVLGDDERAVLVHLGDGEAQRPRPVDLLEEAVVAAGRLRAALDDVAGGDGAGQAIPVVALPAEAPRRRADDQRRVGDAAGDDDVGAAPERLGDAPAAEVRVGGQRFPRRAATSRSRCTKRSPAARSSPSRGIRLSPSTTAMRWRDAELLPPAPPARRRGRAGRGRRRSTRS